MKPETRYKKDIAYLNRWLLYWLINNNCWYANLINAPTCTIEELRESFK
jgi:hypothetical protein